MTIRRAVVIRIAGDAEIGAAIRDGMEMRGTPSPALRATSPRGGGKGETTSFVSADALPPSPKGEGIGYGEKRDPARLEADAVARAWLDGQRLKQAVGNDKGPEDYRLMLTKARGNYAERCAGPVARKLWALAGLIVLGVERFFAWEEARWREG